MELILGQALLEASQMEAVASWGQGLSIGQIIPFYSTHTARQSASGALPLNKLLRQFDASYAKLLLWHGEKNRRLRDVLWEPSFGTMLRNTPGGGLSKVVLLVGPEGDFTESEVQQAMAAGYVTVGLGGARLSAQATACYALACIHSLLS